MQANRQLGHAMIFELIEYLREKLDQFCNGLAMGSFLNLQNEIYFLIFGQLPPHTVASMFHHITSINRNLILNGNRIYKIKFFYLQLLIN